MNRLEVEKKKVTLLKMQAARADMNLKIMEKEEEIERLNSSLVTQDEAIINLELELEAL